jgi:predicted phosphoribosyltransferase
MYFKTRVEAGNLLADQIVDKYRNQNCTVVALSDGGVMVGAQIALRLKCVLTLLLTAPLTLPHEIDDVGVVSQRGDITYSDMYSAGELEELQSEFRTFIEEERIRTIHEMNSLLGRGGLIRRDLLSKHNVILVSDGLNSGLSLEAAAGYLKPVDFKKLIVAVPIASVKAVDRMHVLADEIYCLSVLGDYINTNHYYDAEDIPDHKAVVKTVREIVLNWK